ncbi:MAG: FecR family protein [Imperialibacter sp.]|uniref:FecR family protein n=1 Tax=Imperialibacter sp. TaxID=2038411 RepID=UPI003A8881AF
MKLEHFNNHVETLAAKILTNTASEEELKRFNDWYAGFDDARVELVSNESREELKNRLLSRIEAEVANLQPKRQQRWHLHKVAAVVSFLVAFAGVMYFISFNVENRNDASGDVVYESKSTEAGQKRVIRLPDGSSVKLNAGSTLKYPKSFSRSNRRVELVGEAFFDVSRDTLNPFVIDLNGGQVKVLGTSFNIRSYAAEPDVAVAVKTGEVIVTNSFSNSSVRLMPDELASYVPNTREITKTRIQNTNVVFGWREGNLVFNEAGLPAILKALSSWYGVTFEVEGSVNGGKKLNANFNNVSLEEVLTCLSHNYEFKYEINEKQVTIKYQETK